MVKKFINGDLGAPELTAEWWSVTESPKAWMSVRDADLCETLLHRLADERLGGPLCVVEWGAGRSTLWYTNFLDVLHVPYRWLVLEHNRDYFEEEISDGLSRRNNAAVIHAEDFTVKKGRSTLNDKSDILAVVFNSGELLPFVPGHEHDRYADLDAYVALPARMGFQCHLALIDGRKRRRCILEAAHLIGDNGYVVLHDAFRPYYQSAWSAFHCSQRFGDELWIGSQRKTDFRDVLPWHAFREAL